MCCVCVTVNHIYTRPLIRIRNWFKPILLGVNALNCGLVNPDSNPQPDVD